MHHFHQNGRKSGLVIVCLMLIYLVPVVLAGPADRSDKTQRTESTSSGRAITVTNVAELITAVDQANSGGDTTIFVADGLYTLPDMLIITGPDVTISGASGNREAVILEGAGMWGAVTHIFNVSGSGFTVSDMTLRQISQHAIQLQLDVDDVVIRNLHILDTGEQMVKIPYQAGNPASCDNGLMELCLLEYSAGIGPQYYIGGIDGHFAKNWIVRDNVFHSIRSPADDLAEHAIHFWSNSENTLVERNLIINCDRGIGFGLGGQGHIGGIIRNNMIYHDSSEGFADVGIGLETTTGAQVYNNTIYFENSYPNAIEYRFPATTGIYLANNLTNRAIVARDGATGTEQANLTSASSDWFVQINSGDLHLSEARPEVVDQGVSIIGLNNDFDQDIRPQGPGIDLGADEFLSPQTVPALGPVNMFILCAGLAFLIQRALIHRMNIL
ncbi:right-handed parallel beta-helix repeat-containing protein [bacterium]|nr:right-handed parallel beta-helix repeat-containing protein [bacterium]